MPSPILQIIGIEKSFDRKKVLSGITFEVCPDEIIALLGPSGCGKSTLLAIIAGIIEPEKGEIYWQGSDINAVPPHRRGFGLMFQEDVLFPHMNVFDNVAFGLRMKNREQTDIDQQVTKFLKLVSLQGLEDRDVNTLSGGEQQRVALARSIAPQPGLLMLDEPLSSLDRSLSEHLLGEIKRILKQLKQTAIYVTHDQAEAFSIADRVVLMRSGNVEQIGTPEEIYNHPSTIFAARFLGLTNLIPGVMKIEGDQTFIDSPIGQIQYHGVEFNQVTLLIRPDSATLNHRDGLHIDGKIVQKTFQGDRCLVTVSSLGREFKFYFPTNTVLPHQGEVFQLSINPSGIVPIIDSQV